MSETTQSEHLKQKLFGKKKSSVTDKTTVKVDLEQMAMAFAQMVAKSKNTQVDWIDLRGKHKFFKENQNLRNGHDPWLVSCELGKVMYEPGAVTVKETTKTTFTNVYENKTSGATWETMKETAEETAKYVWTVTTIVDVGEELPKPHAGLPEEINSTFSTELEMKGPKYETSNTEPVEFNEEHQFQVLPRTSTKVTWSITETTYEFRWYIDAYISGIFTVGYKDAIDLPDEPNKRPEKKVWGHPVSRISGSGGFTQSENGLKFKIRGKLLATVYKNNGVTLKARFQENSTNTKHLEEITTFKNTELERYTHGKE